MTLTSIMMQLLFQTLIKSGFNSALYRKIYTEKYMNKL